jgi:hypothetical protein
MSAETNLPIDIENSQKLNKTPQPQSPNTTQLRNLEMKANGGTVIGLGEGKLTCNIHEGFETFDKAEFDKHCEETEGHFITGQQGCITCKNIIEMPEEEGGIPASVAKNLQCPECFEKAQSQHQNFKQSNKIRVRKAPSSASGSTSQEQQQGNQ